MKIFVPVTKQIQQLQEIRCDRCGRVIAEDLSILDDAIEINWFVHHETSRDGGGRSTHFEAEICKNCIHDIVKVLKQLARVKIRETEVIS